MKKLIIATGIALATLTGASNAAMNATICIFDIAGESGPAYSRMKDFKLKAMDMGVEAKLKVYTNEKIAAEDFKAGKCDGVMMTGLRVRSFVPFPGTIDSVGALTSTQELKTMIKVSSSPKNAAKMKKGAFEVAGILPLGSAYIFTRDKTINTLAKAAGKKVAVLDFDDSQAKMVSKLGATPVPVDIVSVGGKFNNGAVDVVALPAIAYEAYELYKGLGDNGGVINYPFLQLTYQFMIRSDKFPADFGQKSRAAFVKFFPDAIALIKAEEAKIDKKYWIDIPKADQGEYEALMQDMRVWLRDEGYYDASALTLMRKIRCKSNPSRAECANPKE